MRITIQRLSSTDQGTRGLLLMDGFWCHTLELPWRDNRPNVSCIPPGEYPLRKVRARRAIGGRRDLYLVEDVPGRSGILIHAGNFAGDSEKGYKRNSWGCPLLGLHAGVLNGQRAVLASRQAVREFMAIADGRDGVLTIIGDEKDE